MSPSSSAFVPSSKGSEAQVYMGRALREAAAIALLIGALGATATARQERPNIVLMFPDNLGYGEVGIYGGDRGVPTPRIDGLAAGGHAADQLQRRDLLHALARGAAHGPARRAVRNARLHAPVAGYDAVGGRRSPSCSQPLGYASGAVRQVAPGRRGGPVADRPGLRRVVRHSATPATRRSSSTIKRHAVHLGRARPASRRGRLRRSISRRGARSTAR